MLALASLLISTKQVLRVVLFALIICFYLSLAKPAFASLSSTPNTNLWATNGEVEAQVLSGTTLYIGGNFTYVGPQTGYGVPLSTSTAQANNTYPIINDTVNVVISDGSSGWYVGGTFTKVGGTTRNRIAHIKSDGTLDLSFDPNANGSVLSMSLNGTTLYVGGGFTTIGGQSRSGIAALDTTTGNATAWDPGSSSVSVNTMLYNNNVLYVSGGFTTIGGASRQYIAALDTTTNTNNATAWNPGADSDVKSMVLSGTTLYVGGTFTSIGGSSRNHIAALNTGVNTNNATAFNPNALDNVFALVLSGTTLYVGGQFNTIAGVSRNRIAALDTTQNTSNATSWNPNASDIVRSLALSGTTMYVSGDFTTIGGQTRFYIGALDTTTNTNNATSWDAVASESFIDTLAVSGSTLFEGGGANSINGYIRYSLAAIDTTTGKATSWNPNVQSEIYAMVLDGTTLYIGGPFTSIGGTSRSFIGAVNTSTGAATSWNPNADDWINALAVSGSTVYAGGFFTTIGGQSRSTIAQINKSDGLATSWNPGTNGYITEFAVSGTTLYAGGSFATISSTSRNNIAAFNTSTGIITSWDPNANAGDITAIAVSGSNVYVGGQFSTIGGQTRTRLAAIDSTTGLATSWNPNASYNVDSRTGFVNFVDFSGSTVYVAGLFNSIGGQSRVGAAALDSTTAVADSWNPNFKEDSWIDVIAVSGSSVFVGGRSISLNDSSYTSWYLSQYDDSSGSSPTPTSTPTPSSSSSTTSSSSSGGNSGGSSCTKFPPTSAPNLFQIDTTVSSATLYFTPLLNPVTGYNIVYGYTPTDDRFGVSFSSGLSPGVLTYTINGLTANTTYYFKIQGLNGCSAGPFSNTLSAKADSSNPNPSPGPSPTPIPGQEVTPIATPVPTPTVATAPTSAPSFPVTTVLGNIVNDASKLVQTSILDFFGEKKIGGIPQRVGVALLLIGTLVLLLPKTVFDWYRFLGFLKDIPLLLQQQITVFLEFVHLRRKPPFWGVVFDALTKQPIDPAAVTLLRDGQEVKTRITDLQGRYGFLVDKGIHTIKVVKGNYVFPSKILSGKTVDGVRNNLYFGQEFFFTGPELVTANIPLDPVSFDWNQANKPSLYHIQYKPPLIDFVKVINVVSFVWLLVSLYIYLSVPSQLNVFLVICYMVVFFVKRFLLPDRRWGVVYNKQTKDVLPLVRVSAQTKEGASEGTCVTDQWGRYYLLLNAGVHTLTVEREDETTKTVLAITKPIIVRKNKTHIAPNISI